ETFGSDLAVRQNGLLLASDASPPPVPPLDPNAKPQPFSFGGAGAGLALHAGDGLRLPDPRPLASGGAHFVITAAWLPDGSTTQVVLGRISTLRAAASDPTAFQTGAAAAGTGRLVIRIQTGRAGLGFTKLPSSRPARFPGAVLAVRANRTGAQHTADALYV